MISPDWLAPSANSLVRGLSLLLLCQTFHIVFNIFPIVINFIQSFKPKTALWGQALWGQVRTKGFAFLRTYHVSFMLLALSPGLFSAGDHRKRPKSNRLPGVPSEIRRGLPFRIYRQAPRRAAVQPYVPQLLCC